MKKIIFISVTFLLFIAGILIFRPVPIISEDKAVVVEGVVSEIHERGVKDIVFKLKGDNTAYYINRGLEHDLTIEGLKEKLVGNHVILKYPKYWTPLDWNNKIRHISKVEFNNDVLFNEFIINKKP